MSATELPDSIRDVAIAELARDMKHVLRWLTAILLALTILSAVAALHAGHDHEWLRLAGSIGLVLILGPGYLASRARAAKYRSIQ